jgi:hypothetical protein
MRSNIDTHLDLRHSGSTVSAHGPISDWEADELSAAITITITQNGVSATGTKSYAKPSSRWDMSLVASNGGEFDDGAASGTAAAIVTLNGGGTENYDWSNPVTLDD